ncbi:MAG TPA: GspH/FimT family pseudopilin [Gammaproteobacteria bacterium]|nr:GspH/FimT family pseudopilin [Gammaproteobacteria bacterium]
MEGKSGGFTLIEMLVTIGLLAILSAIALPSYRSFVAGNRAATQLNTFVADFQYARSDAMLNGTDVSMCASADGQSCAADGDWNQGWIVFMDPNDDRVVGTGDTLLRVHPALLAGDTLIGGGNLERHVTFNRFGMLASLYNGTIVRRTAPVRTANIRCIVVSGVGKVRAQSGASCVPAPGPPPGT